MYDVHVHGFLFSLCGTLPKTESTIANVFVSFLFSQSQHFDFAFVCACECECVSACVCIWWTQRKVQTINVYNVRTRIHIHTLLYNYIRIHNFTLIQARRQWNGRKKWKKKKWVSKQKWNARESRPHALARAILLTRVSFENSNQRKECVCELRCMWMFFSLFLFFLRYKHFLFWLLLLLFSMCHLYYSRTRFLLALIFVNNNRTTIQAIEQRKNNK